MDLPTGRQALRDIISLNHMCKPAMACGHKNMKSLGLLGLRIAIGIIFIYMGYLKIGPNHEMTSGMMTGKLGLPGSATAYFVGLLEFVGGLMVLLGIFASTAALWLAIIVIVAMLGIHRGGPFVGYFLPLSVLGGCLALMGSGAGRYRLVSLPCPCPKCRAMMGAGGSCGSSGSSSCGSEEGSCGSNVKKDGCCGGSCGGAEKMKMDNCACQKCCNNKCGCGNMSGKCGCCNK